MDGTELKERTKRTAAMLFHTLKGGSGFVLVERGEWEA